MNNFNFEYLKSYTSFLKSINNSSFYLKTNEEKTKLLKFFDKNQETLNKLENNEKALQQLQKNFTSNIMQPKSIIKSRNSNYTGNDYFCCDADLLLTINFLKTEEGRRVEKIAFSNEKFTLRGIFSFFQELLKIKNNIKLVIQISPQKSKAIYRYLLRFNYILKYKINQDKLFLNFQYENRDFTLIDSMIFVKTTD